jgi:hypothetical protein
LLWTIKFSRASDNIGFRFRSCNGALAIQQTGSNFNGSYTQAERCPPSAGLLTNGIVRPDRTVTFSLAGPASDPLAWTGFSQCLVTVAGTMNFTGTVSGTLLDASFAQDALIECPNEGFISLNVRVRGAR